MRRLPFSLVGSFFVFSSCALAQTGGDWLGNERGSFPTGTFTEVWTDEHRDESLTDTPRDQRHLTIQIWYPAELRANAPHAPYAPNIDAYDEFTQQSLMEAARRPTNSVVDADIADQDSKFPVILYSHGSGIASFSGTSQTEFLASHGYVVVAIGHTGWDGRIQFPAGYRFDGALPEDPPNSPDADALTPIERYRLGGRRPSLQTRYSTGLEDITFVIDEIERRQQSHRDGFYGRLDTASIGALGFSIGGALALQATISEPRIDAAANLDGGLNGLTVLTEGAKKPILLVEASNRFPRVLNGPADAGLEEFFSEVERETWQALRLSSQEWYKATILGTEHYHFSDAYLIVPPPEGMLDPAVGHRLVNAIVLDFFHRHLQNRPSPILDHRGTLEGVRLTTKLAE